MSIDLRSFITPRKKFMENILEDSINEDISMFIKYIKMSFKSNLFLTYLPELYKMLIDYDQMNLYCFFNPWQMMHIADYGIDTQEILDFALSSLLPEYEILDCREEYLEYFTVSEGRKINYRKKLKELNKEYEKLKVPGMLKQIFIDWLNKDLPSFLYNMTEYEGGIFFTCTIKSSFLYDIFQDEYLKDLYTNTFIDWNVYIDEEEKMGYLAFGILQYESDSYVAIVNDAYYEDANKMLKSKFNLNYIELPKNLIDNMVLYAIYTCTNNGDLIAKLWANKSSKSEVMF